MKLKFLALSLVMVVGVNMVNAQNLQRILYRKTESMTSACR